MRFAYPSRSEQVFDGLDLIIRTGQSIAVVGVNGAGKSTLITLLGGLYRPDSGAILVAGADACAADRKCLGCFIDEPIDRASHGATGPG